MGVGRIREFLRRNVVVVVMLPVLLGLHLAWNKVQDIEYFVPKGQRRDLPIIEGANYVQQEIKAKLGIKEDKETAESCLAALRMVVVDGKVVAGGGCLEAWAASRLRDHLTTTTHLPPTTPHHLNKVGSAFVRVLMELALLPSGGLANRLDWSVDSAYHHLWHTPPNIVRELTTTDNATSPSISEHCVCGLVQRETVKVKHGGEWWPVEFENNLVPGQASNSSSGSSDDVKERCMEEDSLEGSQTTSEEEVDSLEKVVNTQEGEIDSLEGKLDSFDEDEEDSLEGILDRVAELDCVQKDVPPEASLEGHAPGALYDSFPAKFNALRLALEGFTQLLHIGQCVFDQ